MAHARRDINDHDRRRMVIVRLAARIGIGLCRAEYRHLSESEWAYLARLQLQLRELRVGAGL